MMNAIKIHYECHFHNFKIDLLLITEIHFSAQLYLFLGCIAFINYFENNKNATSTLQWYAIEL